MKHGLIFTAFWRSPLGCVFLKYQGLNGGPLPIRANLNAHASHLNLDLHMERDVAVKSVLKFVIFVSINPWPDRVQSIYIPLPEGLLVPVHYIPNRSFICSSICCLTGEWRRELALDFAEVGTRIVRVGPAALGNRQETGPCGLQATLVICSQGLVVLLHRLQIIGLVLPPYFFRCLSLINFRRKRGRIATSFSNLIHLLTSGREISSLRVLPRTSLEARNLLIALLLLQRDQIVPHSLPQLHGL